MILLTGFGPFSNVHHNPSADLVRALHGRVAGGHRIDAIVLPVSWAMMPVLLDEALVTRKPVLAVGFGVAARREVSLVEDTATHLRSGLDVDQVDATGAAEGPPTVAATLDTTALADALGLGLSHDAGTYLCNAWLYHMVTRTQIPAAFVHVPMDGLDPEQVYAGLRRFLDGPGASSSVA